MSNLDAYNLLMTSKSIPKVQSEKNMAAVPREASSIVVVIIILIIIIIIIIVIIIIIIIIIIVNRRHPWFSNQGVPGGWTIVANTK